MNALYIANFLFNLFQFCFICIINHLIILQIINSVKDFNTKNIGTDIERKIKSLRIAIRNQEEELKYENLTSPLSEDQIQERRDTILDLQDILNQLESEEQQQKFAKYLIPKEPTGSNSSGSEEKENERSRSPSSEGVDSVPQKLEKPNNGDVTKDDSSKEG